MGDPLFPEGDLPPTMGRKSSRLMTTTMPNQKDIIEILIEKGIRDKYHVILGGAPVTQEWVDECGADSWGENAGKAVEILEHVMQERRM